MAGRDAGRHRALPPLVRARVPAHRAPGLQLRPATDQCHGGRGPAAEGTLRSPTLWILYLQAFLTMGGFVAMYNFLGFHLSAPPYQLPLWLTGLIFLAYLAGTVSSPRAGVLASRLGRKPVLLGGNLIMMAGVALTLVGNVWVIIAGMVLLTAGFFAAHAVAAGWAASAAVAGRAQSSWLYNLGFYAGSSRFGYLGGTFLAMAGWGGTVGMVLAVTAVATVLVVTVMPHD